jgi:hypothetical protein
MGQAHYLTIRCPHGCEAWLEPSSFGRHRDRCTRRQWVDDLPDSAVIPVSFIGVLAGILPQGLLDDGNPEVRRSRRSEVPFDFRYGRRLRAPVEAVMARRWLHVAIRGLDLKPVQAVRQALTFDDFVALEDDVAASSESAPCASCSEYVARRGWASARRRTSCAAGAGPSQKSGKPGTRLPRSFWRRRGHLLTGRNCGRKSGGRSGCSP